MTTYTTAQKVQLSKHLNNRFNEGTVKGYEVAITLIVMAIREQIDENDIEPILTEALSGNKLEVTIALKKAYALISEGAIEGILGGKDE